MLYQFDIDNHMSLKSYRYRVSVIKIFSMLNLLIYCIDLGLRRPHFYTVPDMKTLFDTVDKILSFVKEINLFLKIYM